MNLLDIGCGFDWISPTIALTQDFLNGPHCHFGVAVDSGWNRGDIRRLFKQNGVKVWGLIYNLDNTMLMLTVPKPQAKFAYALLREQGIAVLYAPAEVTGEKKTFWQTMAGILLD